MEEASSDYPTYGFSKFRTEGLTLHPNLCFIFTLLYDKACKKQGVFCLPTKTVVKCMALHAQNVTIVDRAKTDKV